MPNKLKNIKAVNVYLEKRKTREYVGCLSRDNSNYVFIYDEKYLYGEHPLSLGPDLPLSAKKFLSKSLFPFFEDRIPSSKNPAYPTYCKMVGIEPSEKDPLILVATLGQKGPSSFIFSPVFEENTFDNLADFRKILHLTVREFSFLFDVSVATIFRIENKKTSGKDALKRLEIYYRFPEVALYEVARNGYKINDEKRKYVEKILHQKCKNRQ